MDPLATGIESRCKAVGGWTHMATITPTRGFEWIKEPSNCALPICHAENRSVRLCPESRVLSGFLFSARHAPVLLN